MTPGSRYSLVHLFPTSSSKSAPTVTLFLRLLYEIELLQQFCAPFPDLISQKCSEPDSFFHIFSGNRALATVSCTFCRPHPPEVHRAQQFFYNFYVKSSSHYSAVRILSTSSSKSAPDPTVFYYVYAKSRSQQSCALFVDHFPRSSRATAETETLQRPRQPLDKIPGFAPKNVFKPEFTRSPSLTLPNCLHDDVVDI